LTPATALFSVDARLGRKVEKHQNRDGTDQDFSGPDRPQPATFSH